MQARLFSIARKFYPGLSELTGQRLVAATADVLTLLYSLPLLALGLAWLTDQTELVVLARRWPMFLLLGGLMYIFNRVSFFLITEIRAGGYANSDGALDGIMLWCAVFLFGPTGLWLDVFWNLVYFLTSGWPAGSLPVRWNRLRGYITGQAGSLLSILAGWAVYRRLGMAAPLQSLSPGTILPAMVAILTAFLVLLLVWSGYVLLVVFGMQRRLQIDVTRRMLNFFLLAFGLPALAHPFAILGAGLYTHDGLLVFLFYITGLLLVAYLARQLSMVLENARQSGRQLEALEKLGRDILTAPPDASTLPEILLSQVPPMFTAGRMWIWVHPNQCLLRYPEDQPPAPEAFRAWVMDQTKARAFLPKDLLPWKPDPEPHNALLTAPIVDVETKEARGGVYIEMQSLSFPWRSKNLEAMLPAAQSLAAQVASALYQASIYQRTLASQKMMEQFSLARRIQSSFLPAEVPQLPGWRCSAYLEPAQQIAGDFYDFIPLPENQLGILIADVADKGMGSALYMALCRTLIRTFALHDVAQPERVLWEANRRILMDARANLFVTVFYGALDLQSGVLTYCNAGHTPPLLRRAARQEVELLGNTGMPLGIEEEPPLRQAQVHLEERDVLLLYTDGVTDAQNDQGEFIGREYLLELVKELPEVTSQAYQEAILQRIRQFTGNAPQFDDITLVLLERLLSND